MASVGSRASSEIKAKPLSGQIADALRSAIIAGEYRHGEALSQDSVARRFSVSTMPAREALLALAHEGMVEAQPHKGFRVARMAPDDVEDIYWMHSLLAGRMAARACRNISSEEIAALEEANARLGSSLEAGDIDEVRALNARFHEVIGAAADSPRLAAMMLATAVQIPGEYYTRLPEWGSFSFDDHVRLLEALRRRNARKAESLASAHVATEGRMMIAYLRRQGLT